MRLVAVWLNNRARAAHGRGDSDRAGSLYEKATRADSSWNVPWYNLGLLAKERHDWHASRRNNQEAVRRNPTDEAAWWNLGIAATALSDWAEARRAWSSYGIEIPAGSGEIIADFGSTPIRINAQADAEVTTRRTISHPASVASGLPLRRRKWLRSSFVRGQRKPAAVRPADWSPSSRRNPRPG